MATPVMITTTNEAMERNIGTQIIHVAMLPSSFRCDCPSLSGPNYHKFRLFNNLAFITVFRYVLARVICNCPLQKLGAIYLINYAELVQFRN